MSVQENCIVCGRRLDFTVECPSARDYPMVTRLRTEFNPEGTTKRLHRSPCNGKHWTAFVKSAMAMGHEGGLAEAIDLFTGPAIAAP